MTSADRDLALEQFPEFFRTLNDGKDPFHWQVQLAHKVTKNGWPRVIDLPTATGKTAVIEIAVFRMALDAAVPPGARCAPRRCFFIVDRRVIVDEAYDRALSLAGRLRSARDGILKVVADRLRQIGGGDLPLAVAALRGGMYREDGWARTPSQPLVAVSTVDQVGSRLLFRGYGVSDYAKPIHAGLVGNDALLILDEAHLSRPFRETLEAVAEYRRCRRSSAVPDRFAVVQMSATPGDEADFRLPPEDQDSTTAPELTKRLGARKLARLVSVPVGADDDGRVTMASACAGWARRLAAEGSGARVVAVVVNRVDTARRTFDLLRQASADDGVALDADAVLLTGRSRPVDRDDLIASIRPRIAAGRDRAAEARRLFVVATQCIEAGANFDFDALVTECASLDALRQRFGRLDRLGERGLSPAAILAREDQVGPRSEPDPVYGEALRATWEWLQGHPQVEELTEQKGKTEKKGGKKAKSGQQVVDFGVRWLEVPKGPELQRLLAPAEVAPVLLPAHLDAWVQTHPMPAPDPDVALWLHGRRSGPADVGVVWRADLEKRDLADVRRAREIVAACAPSSAEALPVPLHVARRWLRNLSAPIGPDVEGAPVESDRGESRPSRVALRWRGDESEVVDAEEVRPGDTIVVPTAYGGADRFGWSIDTTDAVSDVGDRTHLKQRAKPVFRLAREVLRSWLPRSQDGSDHPLVSGAPGPSALEDSGGRDAVRGWIERVIESDGIPEWARSAATALLGDAGFEIRVYPAYNAVEKGLMIVGRRRLPRRFDFVPDFTTDDDSSCLTDRLSLKDHCQRVCDRANDYAEECGLPEAMRQDVALAGWLHDVGKADPRFQLWLYEADPVALEGKGVLLAKSGMTDQARIARARLRSGYPEGARHEIQSVALLDGVAPVRSRAYDWELVLHLVGSHHGRCRPFAPFAPDREPVEMRLHHGEADLAARSDHTLARLDSEVVDRFWRLVEQYGWWALAYLETILRLADHRVSTEEAS